jgi:Secretion system C-terminal sorting domain
MKKYLFSSIAAICSQLGIMAQAPQQLLFVSGKDATAPELFIQAGQTGFVYVQGGVTANNSTTPSGFGTGVGTGTGRVVVNGGLFIGLFGATPGDIVNATNARFEFDYTLGGTASATALSGTMPTLTGAADGVNTRGGTVHLMSGLQNFIGLNTNTTDEIAFYNLSLEGNNQDKNLENVNIETGAAGGASSTGTLFLHDNYLNTVGNVAWVRNTNAAVSGALPTTGLGISRDATGSSGSTTGMVSLQQFAVTNAGMVTSTGQGRLRRSVTTGAANPYLFPIGSADKVYYRPLEIIAPTSTTTYYARLELPNVNQLYAGSPAPRATNPRWFHLINSDDNTTDPEFRIYGTLIDFIGANPQNCSNTQIASDIGLAQTELNGNTNWGYQNGAAVIPGSGYMTYVTSVNYPSTGPASCGTGTRITYRAWGGLAGSAANEEGYVFAAKPTPCAVNPSCLPLPSPSLLSFDGVLNNTNTVNLQWKVSNEDRVKQYELERSIDGINFGTIKNEIVFTPASTVRTYTHPDILYGSLLSQKSIYYRLTQRYNDGNSRVSNIVKINLNKTNNTEIYPNPFTHVLHIVTGNQDVKMISIYDAAGKLITQRKDSSNVIVMDELTAIAKGVYTIKIVTNKETVVKKIVKE